MVWISQTFHVGCRCLPAVFLAGVVALTASSVTAEQTKAKQPEIAAANCRALSVGGANGWEPITYIRESGEQTGLAIDILQEYAERNNLRLDLNIDIPWTRAIQMLRNGELDVIAGAYFTAERDRTYFYSAPFSNDDIMVFQRSDKQFPVIDLHDLIGYRGARPQGGSYGDYIDGYAQEHLDMIYSPTGNRIFDVLMKDRADYVILGRFDGLTNLYRDNLIDEIKVVEPPIDSNEVRFMFSRESPCMGHVKQLNLLIKELADDGTLESWTHNHLVDLSEGAS